jgi:hypothetical protein
MPHANASPTTRGAYKAPLPGQVKGGGKKGIASPV